jgi:hypothetical protein
MAILTAAGHAEREEVLRELATAAWWVDRSAFKKVAGFA